MMKEAKAAAMNEIPKMLRIGYQDVSVTETSFEEDTALTDSDGYYLSAKAAIAIKKTISPREKINTVLHECLHAIFHNYGMREVITDKDREEFIVNTLGNGLTQVLVSNPALLDWIKANA